MKIATMQSHIVAVPPPHIGGMYWIFVTLQTTCGIKGVGCLLYTSDAADE